jgi:hypothetical protein
LKDLLPASDSVQPGSHLLDEVLLPGTVRDLGGLDYRPDQLGRVAVEWVVAQIHRNERGSPPIPQTVLIDAVWVGSRSGRVT